ncbi:MAG: plastocyanin/azurin family copper-binding protein [Nitrososphaeraceae archaeon]
MTKPIMTFLFIAGLLIMASALQSTTYIFNMHIVSKMAFAQQQKTSTGIISKVRTLLNQTLNEYRNQNFTGAQSLATSAYLDHFEFIEVPLEKHDKALKNDTEIMLREKLRQMISQAPVENIQQLINKININLDKAESLLANELPTQTITSATSSASQTNLTTNSSSLNTMKVRIIADEAEEPYMPGSIIINNGDKVSWINTDVEAHTMTSGLASSTDRGKQFNSGLLNANQTFEHTFDKPGTYSYYCTIHPIMTGLVNVN